MNHAGKAGMQVTLVTVYLAGWGAQVDYGLRIVVYSWQVLTRPLTGNLMSVTAAAIITADHRHIHPDWKPYHA